MLLAALLAVTDADAAIAVKNRCLGCHPVHYQRYGGCQRCHRGDSRTGRKQLAHTGLIAGKHAAFLLADSPQLKRGKRLAEQLACRRCHTLEGKGNRLSANLDTLLAGSSTAKIESSIKTPAIYMPDFHLAEGNLEDLITAILAAGAAGKVQKTAPQVVHFQPGGKKQQDVFTKHCGGCHRIISASLGGIGAGISGPNLSALLSSHYPANYPESLRWNVERLKKWLKNPRKIRPATLMGPIKIGDQELEQLLKLLDSGVEAGEQAKVDLL